MPERYFAGTLSLFGGRSSGAVEYVTTASRFDPAYTAGCIRFPALGFGQGNTNYCQVPIGGPRTVISGTPLWTSALYRLDQIAPAINGPYTLITWHRADGSQLASVFFNNGSANFRMVAARGGGQNFTGPTVPFPLSTLVRVVVKIIPGDGPDGEMSVYLNGNLVASTVGGFDADFDDISFVRFTSPVGNGQSGFLSQAAMADFDLRAFNFGSDVLTADGFYTDGTGDALDTASADFTSFKGLPAVGNRFTGTSPARVLTGNEVISAVSLSQVARAVSPAGNAAGLLRIGSNDYEQAFSPVSTPGFEIRSPTWDVNPDTGLDWDLAAYNAMQRGARVLA